MEGQHGKGGGYRMALAPEDCTAGRVLRVTEGELAPADCIGESAKSCARAGDCRMISFWADFYRTVQNFLDSVTIADLMRRDGGGDYVI